MTNGGSWLGQSAEEAKGEAAIKTADLVNRTFTIASTRPVEFKGNQGTDEWDHIGVICFDGSEEWVEAWIGGMRVKEQLLEADRQRAYPLRVSMKLDGKAYELIWPSDGVAPKTPPPQAHPTAGGDTSPDTGGQAPAPAASLNSPGLLAYLKERGHTASDALGRLGWLPEGKGTKATWDELRDKNGFSEAEFQTHVLEALVALDDKEGLAPPEDIPFVAPEDIPFE